MSLTVLIAEDDRDVAEVVEYGIRLMWPEAQVTIAVDGIEALRCFSAYPVDLLILDVAMPGADGFEVCRRVRAISRVPIMMLTARDSTLAKVRALDLGADDYLTKPFDNLELQARLRALYRRASDQAVLTGDRLEIGDVMLDGSRHLAWVREESIHLTATEYRLLELLLRHAGTPLPHQYLVESLWGPEYARDSHQLAVYIQRLRRKLADDAETPRYIETVWGIGYRFLVPS